MLGVGGVGGGGTEAAHHSLLARLTVRLLHNDKSRFLIQPQTSLFSPTPPRRPRTFLCTPPPTSAPPTQNLCPPSLSPLCLLPVLQPTLLPALMVHAIRKPVSGREEGRVVSVSAQRLL